MPEKETIERARADKREGKSPTTQAGEFVREEIHHVREGKSAASHASLSKQAHAAARQRTAGERSAAAEKAVQTKGPAERHAAAMKAVQTKGHAGLARAAHKAARTRAANA